MGKHVTDYLLYKRRYLLGYTLIGLAVIGLLTMAGVFVPGGLSQAETESVVKSSALSLDAFDPATVINLPYHLLQRVSIEIFGVTQLSIKLPSLVLGALTILGVAILLRMWFRHNVAIIAIILVVTTGQFLFIAQNGTPGIVYMFWSAWLLIAAMMISRRAKYGILWKIALFAIAALSLYTPLSLYILIALTSAMLLHPHLRYIVRRLSKWKIAVGLLCALVLLIPLAYASVKNPSVGLSLLGIPDKWPDIWANILQLIKQYFYFAAPGGSIPMAPMYGLGSVILILLGIMHLATTKYTARSYIISAWIILLLPIILLNPHFTSVTSIPVLLLMAMGIHMLLKSWYRLFPRNPYARIAGLLPLAILIGGMVLSGLNRYTYGHLYNPDIARHFSHDLTIINQQLADSNRGNVALVVDSKEAPFYTAVAASHKNVMVGTAGATPSDTTIVTHAAHHMTDFGNPLKILTDGSTGDADRFYVYKTNGE